MNSTSGIEGSVPLKDDRDPHLKNIEPLRDSDSVDNQPGGAYLMRTSTPLEVPTRVVGTAAAKVELSVTRGKAVTEVHQQFGSWGSQVVRLRDGSAAVEIGEWCRVLESYKNMLINTLSWGKLYIEWTVGPVPIGDNIGKEVISKLTSDLATGMFCSVIAIGRDLCAYFYF